MASITSNEQRIEAAADPELELDFRPKFLAWSLRKPRVSVLALGALAAILAYTLSASLLLVVLTLGLAAAAYLVARGAADLERARRDREIRVGLKSLVKGSHIGLPTSDGLSRSMESAAREIESRFTERLEEERKSFADNSERLSQAEAALGERSSRLREVEGEARKQERDLRQAKTALERLTRKQEQIDERHEKFRKDHQEARDRIRELEGELAATRDESEKKSTTIGKLEGTSEAQGEKITDLERRLGELSAERAELQRELAEERKLSQDKSSSIGELEANNRSQGDKINQLAASVETLSAQRVQLEGELSAARDELHAGATRNLELEARVERQAEEIGAFQITVKDLESARLGLREERDELHTEVERLQINEGARMKEMQTRFDSDKLRWSAEREKILAERRQYRDERDEIAERFGRAANAAAVEASGEKRLEGEVETLRLREAELTGEVQRLEAKLAQRGDLSAESVQEIKVQLETQLDAVRVDFETERASWLSERNHWLQERKELQLEKANLDVRIAELEKRSNGERQSWDDVRESLEAELAKSREECLALAADIERRSEEWNDRSALEQQRVEAVEVAKDEVERRLSSIHEELEDDREILASLRAQSERLQGAERLRFFDTLSGKIRGPVQIASKLADDLVVDGEGEGSKERAAEISSHLSRLDRLVSQVVELSKLEESEWKTQLTEVNLYKLLSGNLAEFKDLTEARKIDLESEIPSDLPVVQTDERLLLRSFKEILSNAVNFTERGGRIGVQAHVEHKSDGSRLHLAVSDSGEGISSDDRERIFGAFEQADSKPRFRSTDSGAGLGLTLARHYVELLGGEIRVESQPGQGSVFTIIAPVEVCVAGAV